MKQLGFNWTDFHKIWYLMIKKKLGNSSFFKNLTRNMDTLREELCTFMKICHRVSLRMTCVPNKVVKKRKYAFRESYAYWTVHHCDS